jgi:hypothetical protein
MKFRMCSLLMTLRRKKSTPKKPYMGTETYGSVRTEEQTLSKGKHNTSSLPAHTPQVTFKTSQDDPESSKNNKDGLEKVEEVSGSTKVNSVLAENNPSWCIGGASVIGAGHITNNTVCQDSHHIEYWMDGWGVALVSDGAGSKKYSEIGSQQVTQFLLPAYLKEALQPFMLENRLPSEFEWKEAAIESLANTYSSLASLAKKQGHQQQDYACTVMLSVFSPFGILFAHIGDGRACYRTQNGEWLTLLVPMKGEEANQTLFITEPSLWISREIASKNIGVKVVENVTGFSLMTDGCEKYFFECSQFDEIAQKNIDKNRPFQPTFNFFYNKITGEKFSSDQISASLKGYLENDKNLKKEQDDKTLLIAVKSEKTGDQK